MQDRIDLLAKALVEFGDHPIDAGLGDFFRGSLRLEQIGDERLEALLGNRKGFVAGFDAGRLDQLVNQRCPGGRLLRGGGSRLGFFYFICHLSVPELLVDAEFGEQPLTDTVVLDRFLNALAELGEIAQRPFERLER